MSASLLHSPKQRTDSYHLNQQASAQRLPLSSNPRRQYAPKPPNTPFGSIPSAKAVAVPWFPVPAVPVPAVPVPAPHLPAFFPAVRSLSKFSARLDNIGGNVRHEPIIPNVPQGELSVLAQL